MHSNHNKSPILNQIYNNMLKVNNLGLKHNRGKSKNLEISWQNEKSEIINSFQENRKKFQQNLVQRQEDLLLQVYAKLAENDTRKRSFVDKEIDLEYEKLQRKYCPQFKLSKNKDRNYISKERYRPKTFNKSKHLRGLETQEHLNNNEITKEKISPKFPLNKIEHNFETNSKDSKNPKDLRTPNDSDKTLMPENSSVKCFDQKDNAAKENHKICESFLKTLNKPETFYRQIQQIFYHETNLQNTNNKLKPLRLEIRQAITMGKSPDPIVNKLLADVIEKALNQQYSWTTIQSTINDIKNFKAKQKILHLLQIILTQRVYIICTVRTCNFSNFLMILERIMQPVGAQFSPILHHFQHCCVIEAIVPANYLKLSIKNLHLNLDRDADILRVSKIDVVDGERGEVCVQCLPVSMSNTAKSMESMGYTLLNTDYGFRANKLIILDTKTASLYRKFINNLLQMADIETISDNVLY